MAITRRQFLKRAGFATAGTMGLPTVFGSPLVRNAFADTIGDRYLVIVFLTGGNDGLNTVIPIDNAGGANLRAAYEDARGTGGGGLRISSGEMAIPGSAPTDPNTGTALGFHPGLAGLGAMYDAGDVAVVQGTGYPDYSLSHESSRIIWQTANPTAMSALSGSGWAGRHLGLEYGPSDVYGVTIDDSIAPELRTSDTSVLAINNLGRFGFPTDNLSGYLNEVEQAAENGYYRQAYQDVAAAAGTSAEPLTSLLGNSGTATYDSTESYPPLDALYKADRAGFNSAYSALGTGMASDLRDVAKIIYGVSTGQPNVNARFFQCNNGGYDTHADQGAASGQHFSLHAEVANAVELFFADMNDMGVGNKVTMVVWSEFSRRIPQNANGTDHGSQGPMFVIGESVNGGIYGNHPDINSGSLDNKENTVYSQDALDPFRSTDFRDVFGTILKHWVNMDEADILADVLPLDVLGPSSEYWNVQDFDLGFL